MRYFLVVLHLLHCNDIFLINYFIESQILSIALTNKMFFILDCVRLQPIFETTVQLYTDNRNDEMEYHFCDVSFGSFGLRSY